MRVQTIFEERDRPFGARCKFVLTYFCLFLADISPNTVSLKNWRINMHGHRHTYTHTHTFNLYMWTWNSHSSLCVIVVFWTPLGSMTYGGTYTYSHLHTQYMHTRTHTHTHRANERKMKNELHRSTSREECKHTANASERNRPIPAIYCWFLFRLFAGAGAHSLSLSFDILFPRRRHVVAPLYMLTHHASIHSQCRKLTTAKSFKR